MKNRDYSFKKGRNFMVDAQKQQTQGINERGFNLRWLCI
jgi:hypothetical protein